MHGRAFTGRGKIGFAVAWAGKGAAPPAETGEATWRHHITRYGRGEVSPMGKTTREAPVPEPPKRTPIPKRLRFEVLRRDGHACRYCGAMAPEVKLTIDHVTPVVLGGQTVPENLVTSCGDCNSGKASMPGDAAMVADVKEDALRWAGAMQQAGENRAAQRAISDGYVNAALDLWDSYVAGFNDRPVPRPGSASDVLRDFHTRGLPIAEVEYAIRYTMDRKNVDEKWSYAMSICWRLLREIQEAAALIIANQAAD